MFVLLMSGLILYETSNIIHGGETNYIMATVTLFVSIFNLFTSLLHLLGFAQRRLMIVIGNRTAPCRAPFLIELPLPRLDAAEFDANIDAVVASAIAGRRHHHGIIPASAATVSPQSWPP